MIFFIVFGTAGITTTRESGAFYCPSCAAQRTYRRKVVRRFLTIYFIPIIPLDVAADYVQCASCGRKYDESVFSRDPRRARIEFLQDLKRAMVLTMVAEGRADQRCIRTIQDLYRKYAGCELTTQEVVEEARLAAQAGASVCQYVSRIEPRLGREGKALIARAVFLVAAVGEGPHPAQMAQLKQLPAALRIPEAEFRRCIDEAVEGESA